MTMEPFFSDEYFTGILDPARYAMKIMVPYTPGSEFKPFPMGKVPKFEKIANLLGINSSVVHAMDDTAKYEMETGEDPVLISLYSKFLRAAYLRHESVRSAVNKLFDEHEADTQRAMARHDKEMMIAHEKRYTSEKNQAKCRELVRIRWNKLRKGLAKILERDANTDHMHERESYLMGLLKEHSILKMDGPRVMKFYWDRFDDLPVEDIYNIVNAMNVRFEF